MDKNLTTGLMQRLLTILLAFCLLACLAARAQESPYAMMGDNSRVLDYNDEATDADFMYLIGQPDGIHKIEVAGQSIALADTVSMTEIRPDDTMRFMSIDPHANEYPDVSPYAYCMGDPINYIDPTGLKPSRQEAARMADYVYQDGSVELLGEWQVSAITDYNLMLDNGLKSILFERELENGKKEYVLAFAGTDGFFDIDAAHDLLQIFGLSSQYEDAMGLANDFVSKYDDEVTYVGHSLGGGLSAASAFATSGEAITFNAAAVSPFTRYTNKNANIDAYVTTNDPVDFFQKFVGLRADGNITYIRPKEEYKGFLKGHPIKNFY